jgi:hypothetical protein
VDAAGGTMTYLAKHAKDAERSGVYIARHLGTVVPTSVRIYAERITHAIPMVLKDAELSTSSTSPGGPPLFQELRAVTNVRGQNT